MKHVIALGIACMVCLVGATSMLATVSSHDLLKCDDLNGQRYLEALGASTARHKLDSPIGEILWQYSITGGDDNSPKAICSIPDVTGDGIDDVIVGSEDYYTRCLDGVSGTMVWQHEIYPGPVYLPRGLAILPDINSDGYADVVIAATGGARLIQCVSGYTGETLWTHDTHEYGGGGWVYELDATQDYNGDGVNDVLAATGGDGQGTGPDRIYCLNGLTGESIWECPLGGPGFAVMSIADINGDGQSDVLAGCSDAGESYGFAKAIDGATGSILWSYGTPGSSVWGLQQIDDVDGDGVKDVAIGDFLGNGDVFGLSGVTGEELYDTPTGAMLILHLERLTDVNGDGHPDLSLGYTNPEAIAIDGMTGAILWTHGVADQCWQVAATTDVSGDGIDDVLIGTLYNNNYVYFLNGVTGDELFSASYGEAVDALAAIPDVDGDRSMEMVAGGRDGTVTCFAGGPNASVSGIEPDFTANVTEGDAPLHVQFTDTSVAYNTTITSWAWDFTTDGTVDSHEQNPTWTYSTPGTYTVSLTVSDGVWTKTKKKVDFIVVHEPPQVLSLGAVKGGLARVSIVVSNLGETAVDATWNMSLSGGLILRRSFGQSISLAGSGSQTLVASPVLGLGRVEVTVTAQATGLPAVSKTASVLVLGFVVLVQ